MRLAVISDTHLPRGERRLPDACVVALREADLILHGGDFSELSVLEQLRALGPPLAAVHGNADSPEVRAQLPATLVVEAAGARIGMVHNGGPTAGRLDRLHRRFVGEDVDAVVFGHSHAPLHEVDRASGFQIFNPGSPTDRRRQPEHTMGLAHVRRGRVTFEIVALGR